MNFIYAKTLAIPSLNKIIDYKITEKKDETENIYGIELEMYEFEDDKKIVLELETISNLSYSQEQIRELLVMLYSNCVTPRELVYIVDDYITLNPNFVFDLPETLIQNELKAI